MHTSGDRGGFPVGCELVGQEDRDADTLELISGGELGERLPVEDTLNRDSPTMGTVIHRSDAASALDGFIDAGEALLPFESPARLRVPLP